MLPSNERFAEARRDVVSYKMYERIKQKPIQQIAAWDRIGVPVPDELRAIVGAHTKLLEGKMDELNASIMDKWRGCGLYEWAQKQGGLADALFRSLSLMHPLTEYSTIPKMHAFAGLHPKGSRTHKWDDEVGKFVNKDEAYSRTLKVWLMFRVAEPCTKATLRLCTCGGDTKRQKKNGDDACTYACQQCGLVLEKEEATVIYTSPYRKVYDERKDRLPDMLKEGEGCEFCDQAYVVRRKKGTKGDDCHNQGGPHYKAGHRHIDALRVTAKAVLRDCWTVVHNGGPT